MSGMTILAVPIRIDALAVGENLPSNDLFQWTNLTPDFSRFRTQDKYLFGWELSELFRAKGNDFMAPGIHLHFRLPRAFTHGIQRGFGGIAFPKIPNRWLVQRTFPAGDNKLRYKAWLIKSDAEAAQPWSSRTPGVTWPEFRGGQPAEFKAIGLCTQLTGPVDERDEAAALELTAVGPGDPSFSASYPACRSVLGFHDKLADVPAGTHPSYLVTGWYSAATDDPLHAFVTSYKAGDEEQRKKLLTVEELDVLPPGDEIQVLEAWLKSRNWQCGALAGARKPPSRLVCHGLVRGVAWEGKVKNYLQASGQSGSDGRVDVFPLNTDTHQKAYRVAVGDAPGEALAALCADGEVDQDLLTALQAGLLAQDVTISDLRYQLHARRFGGLRGGTAFLIQPEPDGFSTIEATDRPPPPHPKSALLPEPLQSGLRDLNEKQAAFDRQARRVDDCIWQLYACWYLWTTECKGPGPGSPEAKRRKSKLDSFKRLLDSERQALASAKSARDDRKTAIETELGKHPKTLPDGTPRAKGTGEPELMYRLSESTLQPFREPNDPIIAVAGPAMARLNTWQQIDALPCRLSEQVVTGFTLAVPGGATIQVTGDKLAEKLFTSSQQDPGGIHGDLLRESLLLDPRNAACIAGKASEQHKVTLTQTVQALQDPESTSAQQAPASFPNALLGDLPYRIAAFDWKGNPWVPLFLVWEVSWRSDYPSEPSVIAPDVVEKRWTLARGPSGDGNPDLVLGDGAGGTSSPVESVTYQGRSILTPSASKSLADKLAELDGKHPLIGVLRNRPVMSQALDGFQEALMLRTTGTQLPPLDFKRWDDGDPLYLDPILTALNAGIEPGSKRSTFGATPATAGPFFPIRAGRLRIERLAVVDAFGQTVKLPVGEINASSDAMLRRAHNTAIAGSATAEITLRPRFTSAMRLHFDLESAGPDAGAVCGWILPNHMEQSLAIYSATGKPLGAFQKKLNLTAGTSAKGYYWVDFPAVGNSTSDAASEDAVERLRGIVGDAHLLYFCTWVLGLSADEGGFFSTLLNRSIEATDQRAPDEDPGVSVLVGRPLALVRASLRFEAPGVPAHAPELVDAAETVDEAMATRGFERVRWPVRLGDPRARNDGLIGVFACGSSGTTSGPFYPTWGQDGVDAVSGKFGTQDFSLDCVVPLQVTMLMDPQARVHATTGALPRVSLELPTDIASGAKRARDVFFQTAPVLGESQTPHMPRPSDDYGEWSWAYRPDVTNWREDPNLIEATDRGAFSGTWPAIAEGWLKLRIAPVKVLSLWVREGTAEVARGAHIHLAWSLQGAEALELQSVPDGGGDGVTIEKWSSPPFPREYPVTIQAPTTYRLTATAEDAEPDSREIKITLKDPVVG